MRPPSDKIRSFVAIHLSPEAEAAVREARDSLREQLRGLPMKWVSDSNLHLTLRFLGHVPSASLEEIKQKLSGCAASGGFDLETGSLGAFPSENAARVLWVGLKGDIQRLLALQNCVEKAVADQAAHEENKPFNAHLTIARCDLRAPDREWVRRSIANAIVPQVRWHVSSFELMQSSLSPKGAKYSELARYEL